MTDQALIVRDDHAQTVVFTDNAQALKTTALELSGIIGKVDSADTQSQAVTAQMELAKVLKLAEAARVAAKEPVLQFGKRIDEQAKAFVQEIKDEQMRVARLVGDYQQVLQAQARAAQAAEAARLKGIEDARQAELAKCQSHEQLDAVNEKHDLIAQQEQPALRVVPKAEGQVVKEEWSFEITDIWALVRAHPGMVKVEPRNLEIKSALKAGVKLAGVRAWKETKSTVRVPTAAKAIDV